MSSDSSPRSPHVCLVNSMRGLGGAELWFLTAACGLRARGIAVSLVAQPGSAILTRARALDLPCRPIPIRCDGAPWTLFKLWRHFQRIRPTALVCNLTKDLKAAGLAGRWAQVAVRLASRESDFPLKTKPYYRWYFRHAATGILVNSEATRRTVLESAPWLAADRVHLLYKGIDTESFRPAGPPPSQRPPVAGFAGQLIDRKGLHALMEAWERIERIWDDRPADGLGEPPLLKLAGEGPLQSELERWRLRLRRPDHVAMCGFVDDMPAFWAGCRCAVMPSRAEGFGLAAAEASACAVPVVATRVSSLPEVVEHQQTGLLVSVDQPDDLAGAIMRLLQDGTLSDRLGAAGRDRIIGRFTDERCLQQLIDLISPEVPG